jgi:uncharacterized protein (DUF362 family)
MKTVIPPELADSEEKMRLNRRDFLVRLAKVSLGIAGLGFLGLKYYDAHPPVMNVEDSLLTGFPDYSIPELSARLCIVRGSNKRKDTLNLALKALGGIESFIRKDDRVLIKVNAAFATPPSLSATTHPDILEEIIHLCRSAGASTVIVTDNPINDPASSFALTSIEKATRISGGKMVMPYKSKFRSMSLAGGHLIQQWPILYEPFENIQKVIAMAPLKDHHRSGASMIMKNWYGLLGGRRNIFHQNIHEIIMELAMLIKPTLAVLDGTFSMMKNGPTGGSLSDLKQTQTLIVGTDQVAVDTVGATILERSLESLPFILKAEAKNLGTTDWKSLSPGVVWAG